MFLNMMLIKNAKLTTPVIFSTHPRNKIYTQYIQIKYIKTSTNC